MSVIWEWLKQGYLRLVNPLADALVAGGVRPNTITTLGLFFTLSAGVIFASGHISIGGWVLGLTAAFDVLDGMVARKSGQESTFGAFYDSTLDRVADGAVLGGLTVFWAADTARHSIGMVVVCLCAIVGTYLTSYTRARAEGLGLDARVGLMQRPERVVLMSAPQAFFGLAFDGLVLKGIVILLAVTSWITVAQRMLYVRRATVGGAK
jgi:CDP-diacylglycerol--glycerol-3-phosphate 3-phosphatidyltransferase